jgi:mRNA interferase HigB
LFDTGSQISEHEITEGEMIVDGYDELEGFWKKHSRAKTPLLRWYDITLAARWNSLPEVRNSFRHADPVGSCIVFNIHGNDYRLITKIDFDVLVVDVRIVLTHSEYDRNRWKNDCS